MLLTCPPFCQQCLISNNNEYGILNPGVLGVLTVLSIVFPSFCSYLTVCMPSIGARRAAGDPKRL